MIVVSTNAGKKLPNINKVGSSSGQQNVTHQESLRLAVQYHIAGNLSEAESIYRQILQTDSNQPEALNLLGLIAQQAGNIASCKDIWMRYRL